MKLISEYIVDDQHVNMRLDKFVRKYSKEESLALIFSLIRKGNIKVNGKKSKENYRLLLNDKISFPDSAKIFMESKYNDNIDIKDFSSMIVYEDKDIFIINKANNIAMHKGSKNNYGLSEMAKKYYNNNNINFANRLDLATEGLVIGTKNLNILRSINKEIQEKRVVKKYIAMVRKSNLKLGDKFYCDKPLKVVEDKVVISNDGSYAMSYFEVIDIKDNNALLDINLITGRKHQIRVHLAHLGLSIIGDSKYGRYKKEDRMYLKCYHIEFLEYKISIEKKF